MLSLLSGSSNAPFSFNWFTHSCSSLDFFFGFSLLCFVVGRQTFARWFFCYIWYMFCQRLGSLRNICSFWSFKDSYVDPQGEHGFCYRWQDEHVSFFHFDSLTCCHFIHMTNIDGFFKSKWFPIQTQIFNKKRVGEGGQFHLPPCRWLGSKRSRARNLLNSRTEREARWWIFSRRLYTKELVRASWRSSTPHA